MNDSLTTDFDDLDRMLKEEIDIDSSKSNSKQNSDNTKKSETKIKSETKNPKEPVANSKSNSKGQRPPKKKIHLPDIKLDDLPPLSMPPLFKSNSNSSIGQYSSEPASPTSPLGKIESHLNNYLDMQLKGLKNEFCSTLNLLLDKEDNYDNIITRFTNGLLIDVERELKINVAPAPMPIIPFNISIDLPKQRYKQESLINTIPELQARKITIAESLKAYQKDIKREAHDRNKTYKTIKKEKDDMRHKLRAAQKKCYQCEFNLGMITTDIEITKKRAIEMEKRTNELDTNNSNKEMEFVSKGDYLREVSALLPDLSQKIDEPASYDGYGQLLDEELQDIHKRRMSINNNLQEICSTLINSYESQRMQSTRESRTTVSFIPTEDTIPSMSNRLSIMDANQTLLRAPKKSRHLKSQQTINPSFNREKFTLPLQTYIY